MAEMGREELRKAKTLRLFYSQPEGRKELESLILESGLFATIDDGDLETLHLRNHAVRKLYSLGILLDKNVPEIVDKLLAVGENEEE